MDRVILKNPAIRRYLEKASEERIPAFGNFELTPRCNLDCKMCYVHKTDAAAARKDELSTEEWKKIFDDAIEAGMIHALITGGECLLREDFEELYLYLYERGILMSINTNGILLTEEKAAFLDKHRPEQIQISLYGASEDGYENVTGHRAFGGIVTALDLLQKYHIVPKIALTVSRYMAEDLIKTIRFLNSRGLSYICNMNLIESREDRSSEDYRLSTEEKIKLNKVMRALYGKPVKTPPCPVPLPGCPDGEIRRGMPCNAGNKSFSVTWNGRMALCLSYPEISIDIRENSFEKCWSYIRQKCDEVIQPADCTGCAYKANCTVCPSHRFAGLYSGRCLTEQCEETVKMYKAGLFSLKAPQNDQEHLPDGENCP